MKEIWLPRLKRKLAWKYFATVFLVLFLAAPMAKAEDPASNLLLVRIKKIEATLAKIESDQRAILEKQDQIIEDLHTLRIWVRRN